MKKILSLALSLLMLLGVISLAGCGENGGESLKFGLGVYSYIEKATNADGDTQGSGEAVINVAAVLLDKDGKIVNCVIDTADNTVNYTSDGKFVAASEFKTKYELGDAYGMKAYGNATKEWYEQVDGFVSVVKGKTIDEVKALLTGDGKGNDEVINAGCTITVSDFVSALEAAVNNAADSSATADDTLKLGIVSAQADSKDATAEAEGTNEVDTDITAVVLDKDNKVVAASTDCVAAAFKFDAKGTATVSTETKLTSKKSLGDSYGMASYGNDLNGDGEVKEWYQQAAAFEKACEGKTADEIAALAGDNGYGVESLQNAGCTINVASMIKGAVKAATVA